MGGDLLLYHHLTLRRSPHLTLKKADDLTMTLARPKPRAVKRLLYVLALVLAGLFVWHKAGWLAVRLHMAWAFVPEGGLGETCAELP